MEKDLEKDFLDKIDKNQNIIHKICRAYTSDEDSHKDLFQEITIQLWQAYGSFRGEAKFTTWMYRVALNTAISIYRKKSRQVNTSSMDEYNFQVAYKPYDSTEEEQLELIYKAIQQLSDIDKALILLFLEDKSFKEIGETLGISYVNARVKMMRAKEKLKKIIGV
ncbi:RNA polymerase sigma factor [Aureivirga sp. CE67]|uniref:RNA polymerase sigma factor n=1 Tax=Aureivirga sp. CE67 TaxID=1788983 RepID=UPI0018CB9C46|nr:RNA polymerase sigma factor [Aureivirga sp. CE67]